MMLTAIKKYISIGLIGIFLFPIMYQSVHVIQHHENKINECSGTCSCSHEKADTDTDVLFKSLSENVENCPVCEYEFAVNDIPQSLIYEILSPLTNGQYLINYIDLKTQRGFTHKSPRGPPFLS